VLSSLELNQLELPFVRPQVEIREIVSSSRSRTGRRKGGRRTTSGSLSVGSKLSVSELALLCGTSGFSNSPSAVDPTTTVCFGSLADFEYPSQTGRLADLGRKTASGPTE
jgi:hypothetical protein